jgi:hypothetical protein
MAARKTKQTTKRKTASTEKKAPKNSPPATKAADDEGDAKPSAAGTVSSKTVNMGNVFALRPRVTTSFRQENFLEARRLLEDEPYATQEEATRAVAERALELCNEPAGKRGKKRGR